MRRATELDPSALRAIEIARRRQRRASAAATAPSSSYEAFIALDERNARVLYKLGLARYRDGRIQTAVEPLKQALALEPSLGEAYYVLGLVQRDLDQLAGGAQVARRSGAPLPCQSDVGARSAGGGVSRSTAITARAINQLEALAALEPSRADRVVAVGLAQARAGREDAAVVTLGRAVERFPDAPQVYAALGHVWLTDAQRRGDRVALNKAVEALRQAAQPTRMRRARPSPSLAAPGCWPAIAQAAERALRQAVAKLPVVRRTPTCSSPTSRRAMAASRMRAMRC